MKIKKNDTVAVIAGKDKGKTGKVLRVLVEDEKLVVEGINILTKHIRPRSAGEKGQKAYFPGKIHVSKVMLVCTKCGQKTRVGYRVSHTEQARSKKERICKKCTQPINA